MKKWIGSLLVFSAGFVLTYSCADKLDPVRPLPNGGNGGGNGTELVTYTNAVKAILDAHCILCHSTANTGDARNGAPVDVNFNTYELAAANALRAYARIQAGTMPPPGGIGIPVTTEEQTLFASWIQDGTPE